MTESGPGSLQYGPFGSARALFTILPMPTELAGSMAGRNQFAGWSICLSLNLCHHISGKLTATPPVLSPTTTATLHPRPTAHVLQHGHHNSHQPSMLCSQTAENRKIIHRECGRKKQICRSDFESAGRRPLQAWGGGGEELAFIEHLRQIGIAITLIGPSWPLTKRRFVGGVFNFNLAYN